MQRALCSLEGVAIADALGEMLAYRHYRWLLKSMQDCLLNFGFESDDSRNGDFDSRELNLNEACPPEQDASAALCVKRAVSRNEQKDDAFN